ncbi:hypothetical protein D3C72_2480200 [compost metagenome]
MRMRPPPLNVNSKIQWMPTWSPFTSTGRTQVDATDSVRASTALSCATSVLRPRRGSAWFSRMVASSV